MRLTTLARKIDKTPNQLIAFLKEKDIDVSAGLHGKLEREIVEMAINHFLPEQDIEEFLTPENNIETTEIEDSPSIDISSDPETERNQAVEEIEFTDETVLTEEETTQVDETKIDLDVPVKEEHIAAPKTGTIDDLENEDIDEIEHIKVKKVTLEGIKVVGKIELPEKPKKKIVENEEAETPEKPRKNIKSGNRNFDRNRKKNTRGRNRAPLSYEERLKREEQDKLRERRKKGKEEKRRKKLYYKKNLQPKTISTPKKKKKTEGEKQSPSKVQASKNPIRRLWAWLNGEYDQY